VPPPPAQCQAFLEDVPNPPAHYLDQVDAMWISLQTGLPTLNGQASWAPPRWRLDGRSKDYREAAREWISATQLKDRVCLYDREAKRWSIFE
jgi:hypothetical protein